MKPRNLFGKFLIWRIRHISNQQFLLLLSIIVGLLSGLAAIVLKNTIHFTYEFLHSHFINKNDWLFFVLPGTGILLTLLFVLLVVKDDIGHGVSRILYAISRQGGMLKTHHTYSSVVGSTLTIGFGGSVGAEAPVVLTGSAIGSSIGQLFRQKRKTLTLLVGCGAAGAIAGIFKAPIAGIIFTLEVLMLDLTMSSVVPLLIAAATSSIVSFFFLGSGAVFSYHIIQSFTVSDVPFYLLLGLVAGFVSLYFIRMNRWIERGFQQLGSPLAKLLLGSVALGFLIFLFPPLFGEGYESLNLILNNASSQLVQNALFSRFFDGPYGLVLLFIMLVLLKIVATSLTTGSGGVGGIFAPSLFTGGITGFAMALFLNQWLGFQLSPGNFALVGMAGVMAGVMHAPMTAIFLIAELTGGYALFIPLIITSTLSYITVQPFESRSIYTRSLAERGQLITHHKDKAVLSLMRINKLIETDFVTVRPSDTLRNLVEAISHSRRNLFPVVDENGQMFGIVYLDDVRQIMFQPEKYDSVLVADLMVIPKFTIDPDEAVEYVVNKFYESGSFNLPVLDNNIYKGFVSRAKVFSAYRRMLREYSDE